MEWPKIRLETREEALVNTHEQSLSLAVSAEEVTKREREGGFQFIFLFFFKEVTVEG